MQTLLTYALSGICAILLFLSFPPFDFFPLAWIAFAPLFIAIHKTKKDNHALWAGFFCGVLTYALTMYWLVFVMTNYGNLSRPTSVLVSALLISYLSLYFGVFAWITKKTLARFGENALFIMPFAWVALEWARNYAFTGLPWNLVAISQHSFLPAIQISSLVGIYGVSFIVLMFNVGVAHTILKKSYKGALIGAILPVIALFYGVWTLQQEERSNLSVRVAVVQGNVPQDEKIAKKSASEWLSHYIELTKETKQSEPNHIIWPESTVPAYYAYSHWYFQNVSALTQEMRSFLTLGSAATVGNVFYNSAYTIRPDGSVGSRYDKMHLVPFGEYVPLKKILFFVSPLVEEVGDFKPGKSAVLGKIGKAAFGTAICYEIIFPEHSRNLSLKGAQYIITITNDAWFGFSSAPSQHFSHCVFRAVENRKYVIRSANTGISGIVDPYGRIVKKTDIFKEDVFAETIYANSLKTPYVRWGDWFAKLSSAVLVAFMFIIFVPEIKKAFKKDVKKK